MSDLSATTKARPQSARIGGLFIGTAYVPAVTENDTIDLVQVFPNINKVMFAQINGTANHCSFPCDLGGTARVTVGTGNVGTKAPSGELLVLATSE